MKVKYICSPYRANDLETILRNLDYAKELTREVILNGDAAITTHLYMTQCLDDTSPERELGLEAGLEIIKRCDEVIVGTKYGISEGMESEIRYARNHNIHIEYTYEVPNEDAKHTEE